MAAKTSRLQSNGSVERDSALTAERVEEHILIVGWNRLGPHLLSGWTAATAPSSTVTIAFDPRLVAPEDVIVPDVDIDVRLSPTPELPLLNLDRRPTTIVVLGDASLDTSEADTRTMLDVMQLRRRYSVGGEMPRFMVQMLDDEHLELAELTGPDDLLISAAPGSQFIAQLIEQPERREVLLQLFVGDGATIQMVRCDHLELVGDRTADEIVATAYAAGVLAIGWRLSVKQGGQVVLNPTATHRVTLAPDDEIVIIG